MRERLSIELHVYWFSELVGCLIDEVVHFCVGLLVVLSEGRMVVQIAS